MEKKNEKKSGRKEREGIETVRDTKKIMNDFIQKKVSLSFDYLWILYRLYGGEFFYNARGESIGIFPTFVNGELRLMDIHFSKKERDGYYSFCSARKISSGHLTPLLHIIDSILSANDSIIVTDYDENQKLYK